MVRKGPADRFRGLVLPDLLLGRVPLRAWSIDLQSAPTTPHVCDRILTWPEDDEIIRNTLKSANVIAESLDLEVLNPKRVKENNGRSLSPILTIDTSHD